MYGPGSQVGSTTGRAISPVLGIALLITVVALLSVTAATFVLSLSETRQPAPTANFDFEYTPGTDSVTITFRSGDSITDANTKKLEVVVEGENGRTRLTWAGETDGVTNLHTENITAQSELTVDDASGVDSGDLSLSFELQPGDEIHLYWTADGDGTSAKLRSDTVPSLSGGTSAAGILDDDGTVVTDPTGDDAVQGTGGGTASLVSGSAVALGSLGDVDGDGLAELPYVTSGGDLKVNDSNGEVETLIDSGTVDSDKKPDTDKTLMATGSWKGSGTAVFYAQAESEGSGKIYRVSTGGSPTEVADVSSNGVDSVLGVGDIDGDGTDELVYAGNSQEVRYLEKDGTKKTTGFTSGSNNGIGNGPVTDIDDDGTDESIIVDGSNDVRLLESSGATAKPAQSSVDAAKSPVTAADVDDDNDDEIVYLDESSTEVKYIDDVTGSPTVKTLTDEDGNVVTGDKDTGIVS